MHTHARTHTPAIRRTQHSETWGDQHQSRHKQTDRPTDRDTDRHTDTQRQTNRKGNVRVKALLLGEITVLLNYYTYDVKIWLSVQSNKLVYNGATTGKANVLITPCY